MTPDDKQWKIANKKYQKTRIVIKFESTQMK